MKIKPGHLGDYEYLQPIGHLDRHVPLAKSGPNFIVKNEKLFENYIKMGGAGENLIKEVTYERVRALERTCDISLKKCDVPLVQPNFLDPIFLDSYEKTCSYMRPVLIAPVDMGPFEIKASASPGVYYKQLGYEDKGEAYASPEYKELVSRTDYWPIDSAATKDEFLPIEDLENDKLRTTFTVQADLCMKSKILYNKQNKNIIANHEDHWIKYGMSKESGGFHRFVRKFERKLCTHVVLSDCSGWDRKSPLEVVYTIRNRYLILPDSMKALQEWVTFHTVHPLIVLPNGDLVIRLTGNNSGGNNTASDNSILHTQILMHLFVYRHYKIYGFFPTLDDILNNCEVGIYSDDKATAINFEFYQWDVDSYKEDERYIYSLYGMVIKPSAQKVYLKGDRLDTRFEFLGSTAIYHPKYEMYIPYPRVGKIAASIVRCGLTKLEPKEMIMKVLTLTYLLTSVPVLFEEALQYLKYLCAKFDTRMDVNQMLKDLEVEISYSGFIGVMTGRESYSNYNRSEHSDIISYFFFYMRMHVEGFNFAMEARVSRAENLLNKFVNSKQLTPSGADWLVSVLDPFHDTQLKELQGWPDVETGPSVVRCIKQSFQISRPPSVPVGSNWDCHIVMWPWHTPVNTVLSQDRVDNTFTLNSTGSVRALGGIQAFGLAAGGVLSIAGSDILATSTINGEYTQGSGRLTAIGFEVTNTTAPLHRQGTAYVYKQMQAAEEPYDMSFRDLGHPLATPGTFAEGTATYTTIRTPPRDPGEAMLIPGTRQWAAEDGCYMVGSFHSVENRPVAASFTEPVIVGLSGASTIIDDSETPVTNVSSIRVPNVKYQGALSALVDIPSQPAIKIDPVHQSGAIFAGLSDTTTLTFNTIHYYESFPGIADQDILVLATPSAEYDATALNVYSHAVGTMPVGVKVGENGLGDWFVGAIKKLSSFLTPVLSAIPHPMAQSAALASRAVNTGMTNYLAAQSPAGSGKALTKKKPKPGGGAPNTGRGNSKPILNIPTPGSARSKQLAKLSNAALKNKGYTKRQISLIKASVD
jgi:hypothetical protein